jgi:hypothetical protein
LILAYFAQPEFALGEFASIEFSRASSLGETAGLSDGAAATALQSGATAKFQVALAGQAVAQLTWQVDAQFSAALSGSSSTDGQGQSTISVDFSSASVGDLAARSGILYQMQASLAGVGDLAALSALESGFDLRCLPVTSFAASAVQESTAVLESLGEFDARGQTQVLMRLDAPAQANLSAQLQRIYGFRATSTGQATSALHTQQVEVLLAQLVSTTTLNLVAQYQARTGLQAQGAADANLVSAFLQRLNTSAAIAGVSTADFAYQYLARFDTELQAQGLGSLTSQGQALREAALLAMGASTTDWWRGREVLPYLAPAFDRVLHIAEIRTAIRPLEVRTAIRPEELRTALLSGKPNKVEWV